MSAFTVAAPAAVSQLSRASSRGVDASRRTYSALACRRRTVVSRAAANEEDETRNTDQGIFMRQITQEERDAEVQWLAGMLKLW